MKAQCGLFLFTMINSIGPVRRGKKAPHVFSSRKFVRLPGSEVKNILIQTLLTIVYE